MEQSVIVEFDTVATILTRAEGIIDRPLTDMEKALVEYAVDQIRLGLVGVN